MPGAFHCGFRITDWGTGNSTAGVPNGLLRFFTLVPWWQKSKTTKLPKIFPALHLGVLVPWWQKSAKMAGDFRVRSVRGEERGTTKCLESQTR